MNRLTKAASAAGIVSVLTLAPLAAHASTATDQAALSASSITAPSASSPAGFALTSPVAGQVVDTTGSVVLQGTLDPDAFASVKIDGTPAGAIAPRPNGLWTKTVSLTAGEHTLAFSIFSGPSSTTVTKSIAVRAGVNVILPTAAAMADGFAKGTSVLVAGRDRPFASIALVTATGTTVATTRAGAQGDWVLKTPALAMGTSVFTLSSSPVLGGATASSSIALTTK